MKYCSACGAKVYAEPRTSGAMGRFVCPECKAVFYHDPRLAVGCIATWNHQILLCRRGIEPSYGLWELPSGFVEKGETAARAAARETVEEANVSIEILRLYALLHIPHINQVRLIYLARLLDNCFKTGAETLEARLFRESAVPWGHLAFSTTRDVLRKYFHDRKSGAYSFFFAEIVPFEF